jgi:hypothetical protein
VKRPSSPATLLALNAGGRLIPTFLDEIEKTTLLYTV